MYYVYGDAYTRSMLQKQILRLCTRANLNRLGNFEMTVIIAL